MASQPEALVQRWEDLLPQGMAPTSGDPFASLSSEQLEDLAVYSRTQWLLGPSPSQDSDSGSHDRR